MGPTEIERAAKFSTWPLLDRQLWAAGCRFDDPFKAAPYGATLGAGTLAKTAKGYRLWLAFMASNGWFDVEQQPIARVTPQRLRAYLKTLQDRQNAPYTIIGRFDELKRAIRIMTPGADTGWILRPTGVTVYNMLRKTKRHLVVPDARVLSDWALSMMDECDPKSADTQTLCAFRDGLILAILAAKGRRRRSMVLLRVGYELQRRDTRYRIELTPEQVKTKKPDRFYLPRQLTPYMDRYLQVVRPALLRSRVHDELWINAHGAPLTAKAFSYQIFERSKKRFGTGFGPHRARHSIATSCSLRLYKSPGIAAAVLGISEGVVEQSYNRAGQAEAAAAYAKIIKAQRKRLIESPETHVDE